MVASSQKCVKTRQFHWHLSYKVIISFQMYPNCMFAMIFGFLPSDNEIEIEQLQSTTFIADTVGRFS